MWHPVPGPFVSMAASGIYSLSGAGCNAGGSPRSVRSTHHQALMRTALLFQKGNFVGPEYLGALGKAGIRPDFVATVGRMSEKSVAIERKRTAGRWNPPSLPADIDVPEFGYLEDPGLWQALREDATDVVIQGGIGILKPEMLSVPEIGFLNIHPGRLPQYRGNACPEWALHNKDDIYATAHLIDEGIDTGPVICAERYEVRPGWDYFDMRANLYAHCGKVMIQALEILSAAGEDWADALTPQNQNDGCYWPKMDEATLTALVDRMERESAPLRSGSPGPCC